jgi:hypothetical protein
MNKAEADESPITDQPSITSVVLFHAPQSKVCQSMMAELRDLKPAISVEMCNVAGKTARKILSTNPIAKIDGVPCLMVVKDNGEGDIFKGKTKIMQWFVEISDSHDDDDPMVGVPSFEGDASGSQETNTSGLKFAFANVKGGGPAVMTKRPDASTVKYHETRALAKKMEEQMAQTYGYTDSPSQVKLNQQIGTLDAEPV